MPKALGSNELRLAFDAATRTRGKCLKDFITPGPALQNPLPTVVIDFRVRIVDWSADISAMFIRIKLKDEDIPYHRFLRTEENGTTSTCEITRVTFGVNCSPYVAIKTTWRAADEAGPTMWEAAETVRRNLYVDNQLNSTQMVLKATHHGSGVQQVLDGRDFHLRNWDSNDWQLAAHFQPPGDPSDPTDSVSCNLVEDDPEKCLDLRPR